MTTLITGVTGGLGAAILENLSKSVPASDIAVLVRSAEKGQVFKEAGYDVRIGDYSDQSVLENAFAEIETLMFVSGAPGQATPREVQHQNVIAAAKMAGVKNIVYTSITRADTSAAVLAPDHKATEIALQASGLNVKVLRNNWYVENEVETVRAALAGQPFVYAGGKGKVGWAARRDYAEAAAHALTQDFDGYQVYELAGKAVTYADFAKAAQAATGKDFQVLSVSLEDYQKGLAKAGLPKEAIFVLSAIQADIADGQLDIADSDLENLLGRPQTDLVTAIKELL